MISVEKLKQFKLSDKAQAEFKEAFGYENTVTGYDLLHGYCHVVANHLAYDFCHKDKLHVVTEQAYVNDNDPQNHTNFAHEYCVVILPPHMGNKELYIDVRGVYDDYSEFMKEFVDYEEKYHGETVTKWTRQVSGKYELNDAVWPESLEYMPGDSEFDAHYVLCDLCEQLNAEEIMHAEIKECARRSDPWLQRISSTVSRQDGANTVRVKNTMKRIGNIMADDTLKNLEDWSKSMSIRPVKPPVTGGEWAPFTLQEPSGPFNDDNEMGD